MAAADASAGSTPGGPGDQAPGKAAGGPVIAGRAYTVGEKGRELFVPNTSGTIIPNSALGGGSGGGGGSTIIINAIDAKGVIDALAKAKRQNPALFAQLVGA